MRLSHTHSYHLLSDSICGRLSGVTAGENAGDSKVASCSIIPDLETLHIIFLIKSLTIPYVHNEGGQTGEKVYVSVKKKMWQSPIVQNRD